MNIADRARNHAISLEAKKDALSQRQSGDWKVSFTVQGIDMDTRLTQAPMGTRYAMVLVEIGDDEQPVQKEANPAPRQEAASPQPDGAKRDWRDLPPQQRAGIRINEPLFAAYLREEHPDEWHETGEADACLKFICKIESKRDLAANHKALTMFNLLDSAYLAWQAKERVGA
jgi:hypothetical protein